MKKQEISRKLAEKTGLEQKAVTQVLELFLVELEARVLEKRAVQLRPIGTFVVKTRRAKMGRNPYTNEPVPVPEHLTLTFRPSRRFKAKLNQK